MTRTEPSLAVGHAIGRSEPLARLLERLAASRARFEIVRGLLPEALLPAVRPGPLDDDGWTLLAANPSAAAKLRQWLPTLERELADRGAPVPALRARVQPPG
jgi:hypothetical protein